MPAKKGTRPPGRKRGIPNKVTQSAREIFAAFLEHNAPKAQRWLDRVAVRNPGKALDVLVKLAEFFMPKLQRTEVTGKNGTPLASRDTPITDPVEASRIYAQIMAGTEIDLESIRFESPPLAAPNPPATSSSEITAESGVGAENPPPDTPRDDSNVLHLWEQLGR